MTKACIAITLAVAVAAAACEDSGWVGLSQSVPQQLSFAPWNETPDVAVATHGPQLEELASDQLGVFTSPDGGRHAAQMVVLATTGDMPTLTQFHVSTIGSIIGVAGYLDEVSPLLAPGEVVIRAHDTSLILGVANERPIQVERIEVSAFENDLYRIRFLEVGAGGAGAQQPSDIVARSSVAPRSAEYFGQVEIVCRVAKALPDSQAFQVIDDPQWITPGCAKLRPAE